ncbi:MAG TPA: serine protease [Candidatus Dormibacteraeota bacterium]|nr:serine protease [Candidatus Dormibacteraeota bacterium]
MTVKTDLFRDGSGSGAGFVYAHKAHVLISATLLTHVVQVSVSDSAGNVSAAEVVGIDKDMNVAELLVPGLSLKPLKRAAQQPSVGADVYVVGGSSGALAHGVVTKIGADLSVNGSAYRGLIQTTAPATAASGGSPMVDGNGEVVGQVVADATGHALAVPATSFDAKAAEWAKSDSAMIIGPPLVSATAQSLILPAVGDRKRTVNAAWGGTGWHSGWLQDATYSYGGLTVDIYLDVGATVAIAMSNYKRSLGDAPKQGFSTMGSLSVLGDESTTFQSAPKGTIVYEIVWRDRNCEVVLYAAAAKPVPPGFSMEFAVGLALAQEAPIGANLAGY